MNKITIGELGDALGDRIMERIEDKGKCRFNCRTERENWIAGYLYARAESPTGLSAKEAYREYKQSQRSDPRREGIRKTHETTESNGIC